MMKIPSKKHTIAKIMMQFGESTGLMAVGLDVTFNLNLNYNLCTYLNDVNARTQ